MPHPVTGRRPLVTRIWDVERRKILHRLEKCSYDVAFSPVADRLVTCGDFGVYDQQSGEQLIKLAGNVGVYGCVAYSHDGKLIVSGNQGGYVQIWNAETGKEIVPQMPVRFSSAPRPKR